MKKLLQKDKNLRFTLWGNEKQRFVLKLIFQNLNFFTLIRWKAFLKFKALSRQSSPTALLPRCIRTTNTKKFNKLTNWSRHIFLKQIRSGKVSGMRKSSW